MTHVYFTCDCFFVNSTLDRNRPTPETFQKLASHVDRDINKVNGILQKTVDEANTDGLWETWTSTVGRSLSTFLSELNKNNNKNT